MKVDVKDQQRAKDALRKAITELLQTYTESTGLQVINLRADVLCTDFGNEHATYKVCFDSVLPSST